MKESGGQRGVRGREEDQRGQGQVRCWSEEAESLETQLLRAALVSSWGCARPAQPGSLCCFLEEVSLRLRYPLTS